MDVERCFYFVGEIYDPNPDLSGMLLLVLGKDVPRLVDNMWPEPKIIWWVMVGEIYFVMLMSSQGRKWVKWTRFVIFTHEVGLIRSHISETCMIIWHVR